MAKLRPRARIVRTIGDQLISGPEAALIELVKNSYDADSPYVLIRIIPPRVGNQTDGSITISDAGHGMSESDVVGKWLEPATDEKLSRRTSPGGRPMLGAKGIGRFAAARLGRWTTLRTVNREAGQCPILTTTSIDWEQFQTTKYLDEVEIAVDSEELAGDPERASGSTLEICGLRDPWTQRQLEVLIRELRRVSAPQAHTSSQFDIRLDITAFSPADDGFDGADLLASLNVGSDPTQQPHDDDPLLIHPFQLQKHADYTVRGTFDAEGSFSGNFVIERGDQSVQKLNIPAPAMTADESSCGPLTLQINIYDGETDALQGLFERMGLDFGKIGVRAARRALSDSAGVAIFRNGFRIRPYGSPESDWLELERQRVQDPSRKLGQTQVSGVVDIGDEKTSGLVERSSREGLEHSGSFDRLKQLMLNVLVHAEARRFEFRERAGLSRKAQGDLSKARQVATLRSATKAARNLPPKYRKAVEAGIAKDTLELSRELAQIDDYQQALQSRSALGLVVAEVLHEGRRLLNPVSSSAKALVDSATWVLESTRRGEVFRKQFPEYAKTIHDGVSSLVKLFKRLDPLSGRRRGKPRTFSIEDVLTRSLELFRDQIAQQDIDVSHEVEASLEAYGYEEDLQAAFMNLIDNAIFWLATTAIPRRLSIIAHKRGKWITVRVANSGPAIDEAYAPRLFDAGFTLKTDGTGLGLAIAREAVRRSKGDLLYEHSAPETTFLVRLRSE